MAEGFTIPDEFNEAYEVARTLDVVHQRGRYRIEVVRVVRGAVNQFAAHYYEQAGRTWAILTSVPSVAAEDLDLATHQALNWLSKWGAQQGKRVE